MTPDSLESSPAEAAGSGASRVLVVEDDAAHPRARRAALGLEGITPTAVGRRHRGASRWRKREPFDLIVLDLMLPGLDGISLCRAIRREELNGDVPILMLTARREEPTRCSGSRAARTTT